MILAATNRPDLIDPALLRPGRFDSHVVLPIPDEKARKQIFSVHTKTMPLTKDISIDNLVSETKGYTGADIEGICRDAGLQAIKRAYAGKDKEHKISITKLDFDNAFKTMKNSKSKNNLEMPELPFSLPDKEDEKTDKKENKEKKS
jgi:transitional endoplasmic reticulum ATPase